MKICAYVQTNYGMNATTYVKGGAFNSRQWVGLQVVIDSLVRAGYVVEYAGAAAVHRYDLVLVSITGDRDWWTFIAERRTWAAGDYRVVAGGAAVLSVRPFLPFVDCFVLGRGENVILDLLRALERGEEVDDPAIVWSRSFSMAKQYRLRQESLYPHTVQLSNGRHYREMSSGCPWKCTYCGYTYHRKYEGASGDYEAMSGLWSDAEAQRERALLDMRHNDFYDLAHLRITAIDGLSERLRRMVAKPIRRDYLTEFYRKIASVDKKSWLKLYNIVGYPGETEDDWREFLEDLARTDAELPAGNHWALVLHSTPFRAMPVTPAACWPMSYRNYRGQIAKVLGRGKYRGNIFFKGNKFWAGESNWTESLATVILTAIVWRGTEDDSENIARVACSTKFWAASSAIKQATLEKYFDCDRLFAELTPQALPTRNIGSYLPLERAWGRKPWEKLA